jgi:dephospho-CoA kinase
VRLGITGGIGSGKSTVTELLAQQGASVIDADAISRFCTGPNGAAIAPLKAAFGPEILTTNNALNRDKMRQVIYADVHAKSKLESIVHPLVQQEIAVQTQRAVEQAERCIVFDIPLLVETKHWRNMLDRILVIDCSAATQIARVSARNGLGQADIAQILSAQASREIRLRAADMVIFNDGISLCDLAQHANEIGQQFGL